MDTANFDTEFTQAGTEGKLLFVERLIAKNEAEIAKLELLMNELKAYFAEMNPIGQCLVIFLFSPKILHAKWLIYRKKKNMRKIKALFTKLRNNRARKEEK